MPEVVGKVALEERVDAATQHKPHHDGHIAGAGIGPRAHQDRVRGAEDGHAAGSEHADQLERVPLVGHVAHDLHAERVVRVQRRCGGCVEGHGGAIGRGRLGDALGEGEDVESRGAGSLRRPESPRAKGAVVGRFGFVSFSQASAGSGVDLA